MLWQIFSHRLYPAPTRHWHSTLKLITVRVFLSLEIEEVDNAGLTPLITADLVKTANWRRLGIELLQALSLPAVWDLGHVFWSTLILHFLMCEMGRIVKIEWDLSWLSKAVLSVLWNCVRSSFSSCLSKMWYFPLCQSHLYKLLRQSSALYMLVFFSVVWIPVHWLLDWGNLVHQCYLLVGYPKWLAPRFWHIWSCASCYPCPCTFPSEHPP